MSFSSYYTVIQSQKSNIRPIRVDETLWCVPEYSSSPARGVRVSTSDYVPVELRKVDACDGATLVYVCPCKFMMSCRERLDTVGLYSKNDMIFDPCFHIRYVMEGSRWFEPESVVDDVVHLHGPSYCIRSSDGPKVLKRVKDRVRCMSCRFGECPHVRRLETVAIDHPEMGVPIEAPIESQKRSGVPRDAIETPQQKIRLAPKPREGKRCPDRSRRVARVYGVGGYTEYTYNESETLDQLRATMCDEIFRYSREVWCTHGLIHLYIDNVARGNACFDAFHNTMVLQYARVGQDFCSKKTTRTVLQASLHHLDLDVSKAMTCDVCRSIPIRERVFILDGTSNGFLDRTKTQRCPDHQEHRKQRPGSDFALVKSTRYRSLLLKSFEDKASFDRRSYLRGLGDVPVPGLVQCLTHALEHCPLDVVECFLKDIGSPYPIIASVQRDVVMPEGGLLGRLFKTITRSDRDMLRTLWPGLSKMLIKYTTIPEPWRRLLVHIRDTALESYLTSDTEYLLWPRAEGEHSFICFPDFPRIRQNPWPRQASTFEASCTKHILQHRHFSPGLFLICCPHAKILGFCAMQEYESVHTAFEIIVERFEVPPGMIIYDNGCNLFRYGMMRCPGLFSNIRILIDKFHSTGHVMCPPSFTFGYYPDNTPVLGGLLTYDTLNTQAVEQTNGRLRKFQQTLGFMTQENYISFVKVLSCLLNTYV